MVSWILWQAYLLNYAFVWGLCGLDWLQLLASNAFNRVTAVRPAVLAPN